MMSPCILWSTMRHPSFTQQYHLNALPLSLGHFPVQCCLQLPNLAFRAFDHLCLPKQMATWNHTISLAGGTELPQTRRFSQLWKWYYTGGTAPSRQSRAPPVGQLQWLVSFFGCLALGSVCSFPALIVAVGLKGRHRPPLLDHFQRAQRPPLEIEGVDGKRANFEGRDAEAAQERMVGAP
jgi:hypothetical protein